MELERSVAQTDLTLNNNTDPYKLLDLELDLARLEEMGKELSYDDQKAVLRQQYVTTTKIGIFALIVGSMHGWTRGIQKDLQSGVFGFKMTRVEYIYLSALLPFGSILSVFPSIFLARKIGIRRTLQCLLLPALISWIFLGVAQNVNMFYGGRFIAGLSVGGYKTLITIYVSEIVQRKRRGSFSSMGYELFFVLGILYDQILVSFFGARICTYLCAILPVAAFGVSYFIPETPYYYLERHDAYGCKTVLIKLRGEDYDITADYVEVYDNYKRYMTVHVPVLETMSKRITKKSLMIAFGLVFFQQLSGINVVLFYIYNLLQIAHVELNIEYMMIIIDLLQILGIFMGVLLVDQVGRKLLLLVSEFSVTICALGVAWYYYMNAHFPEAARVLHWLPVFCTSIYIFFFAIGLGAVAWLVLIELFPFNIKYHACAIASIFQSVLTFAIVMVFYFLALNIRLFVLFIGFATISLIGFFFVLFWIPETRNREFSSIQAALELKSFY